jgi:chromosome partitioning protein
MAKIIALGMGKGGVGKTTTCATISDILSEAGYRILGVDFDPQGNYTQMATRVSLFDFEDKTIFEAMKEKDPSPYIYEINEKFHILPSDDYLAYLSKYLYRDYEGNPFTCLSETLDKIKDNYDFILIDLPPNLGDHTLNGLTAADYAIPIFQPEPFCFDGLIRYIETIEMIQEETNPKLKCLGILTSMMDSIAAIDEAIYQKAKKLYGSLLFETVIKRRVRIKEYSFLGIQKTTTKDQIILRPYVSLVKEVLDRVENAKKEVVCG